MRFILRIFFQLYRLTLAPLFISLGGGCRFYPSCSHYSEQAIHKYGFWRGSQLTLGRLSRCQPWHPGGVDGIL